MFARITRILLAATLAACVLAPAAAQASPARTATDATVGVLSAIESIRIGANTTVITIQNGPKSHPIVIDYAEALQTGVLGVNNDGSSSRIMTGDAPVPGKLPASLSLGQIAALLLLLTVVSRVIGIARQLVPARR